MPVILLPGLYEPWLDPKNQDVVNLQAMLAQYPAEFMKATPVGPLVGNVKNQGVELVDPLNSA
jgi:putative SOS response-associated peptidase YedK